MRPTFAEHQDDALAMSLRADTHGDGVGSRTEVVCAAYSLRKAAPENFFSMSPRVTP
jgi:hypothetical protein